MSSQILPLGIKNRTKTELPALIALEAIGQSWFSEDHRCDLMSIAMVVQFMVEPDSELHAMSCELVSLLGPDVLDIEQLRPLVVTLNCWLQRQSNGRVQAAINRLLGHAPKVWAGRGSKTSARRAHG